MANMQCITGVHKNPNGSTAEKLFGEKYNGEVAPFHRKHATLRYEN